MGTKKDIKRQVYYTLKKMYDGGRGRSRDADKRAGATEDYIYSSSTLKSYTRATRRFVDWLFEEHPHVRTLAEGKKYVNAWLRSEVQSGKSAWTTHLYRAAVYKLYGIRKGSSLYTELPARRREDIKRSRGEAVRDRNFNEANHKDLVAFCRCTGARRGALERLKGEDLFSLDDVENASMDVTSLKEMYAAMDAVENFSDCKYFIRFRGDKGGKTRFAPIVGPEADRVVDIMRKTPPDAKVWGRVNANMDVHSYRAVYCERVYLRYARDVRELHYIYTAAGQYRQPDLYCCRGDMEGLRFDRRAMKKASVALGHSRISVIAEHYLYSL